MRYGTVKAFKYTLSKMHISKFRKCSSDSLQKLGDSQQVKMGRNKHEFGGIPPGNNNSFAPSLQKNYTIYYRKYYYGNQKILGL